MSEVKGVTWDFAGHQLGIKSALALAYVAGFRGKSELVTAVSVMTAESQRYTSAWHHNHEHAPDGSNVVSNETGLPIVFSTDHGLMQINREGETIDPLLMDPKVNTKLAHKLYRERGFQPWAAFNSGRFLAYWDDIAKKYDANVWRAAVPLWLAR